MHGVKGPSVDEIVHGLLKAGELASKARQRRTGIECCADGAKRLLIPGIDDGSVKLGSRREKRRLTGVDQWDLRQGRR